jgi:DNA-binding CsgD family transcriptional regulator
MARLLEAAAAFIGTPSLSLELTDRRTGHSEVYGQLPDATETICAALTVDEPFRAHLLVAGETAVPAAVCEVVSLAVQRTLEARWLQSQATLLRCAFDAATSAVLVFARDGDIVYANPPADRLLSQQTEEGLLVVRPGERSQPLFTLLCSLVERVAGQQEAGPPCNGTLSLSDGTTLSCEVLRLSEPPPEHEGCVLAVLRSTEVEPNRRLQAFAQSHHLSPREIDVLRLLREGGNTSDIAAHLGISSHTVRDHLKNLFRKTRTRSRNQLLNLLANGSPSPPLP